MVFRLDHQMYRAVNTGAGIPPAVGLQGIVHIHHQRVDSDLHNLADIYCELCVAIGMVCHFFSIYENRSAAVHAFKYQGNVHTDLLRSNFEFLLVNITPAGEIAAISTVQAFAARFRDHCIMGKVHCLSAFGASILTECPVSHKVHLLTIILLSVFESQFDHSNYPHRNDSISVLVVKCRKQQKSFSFCIKYDTM